jgi:hypothetical protein
MTYWKYEKQLCDKVRIKLVNRGYQVGVALGFTVQIIKTLAYSRAARVSIFPGNQVPHYQLPPPDSCLGKAISQFIAS